MSEAATTTAAATDGAATSASATTTTAAPPWHGIAEPEGVAYVATKGWQNPGDVIKSYQNAEKLIGRDPNTLLTLPRADDPVGFRAVMSKLGLPETADKYEFDTPKGMTPDENYLNWARNTFHELGLPASTVKALSVKHNAFVADVLAKQEADYNMNLELDKKALLSEWKGGHERMLNAAQSAAKSLGFDEQMITAIEKSVGYAKTMKFFASLGQKMGEDKFVTPDGGKPEFSGSLTPAEAKSAWEAMKIDPVAMAALGDNQHPGHAAAKAKQASLFKIMYPV